MGFFFRIVFMFLALGSIMFFIWKLNTTGLDPALFHLDQNQTQSFGPDNVTHFEWKSSKKIFSYDRAPGGDWLPQKNEAKLMDLLDFLSQIQLTPVEQKGSSSLDVVLDINGVRWVGAWDGLSFVWKLGPHAGLGEILPESKNIVFFKGAHIFDTVSFNLCANPITKIYLQAFGKNYKLEQTPNGWNVTEPKLAALDGLFMEKWLVDLCQIKVKSILDLTYAQSNTKQGAITFEFANNEKINLAHVEKDFFVMKDIGMVLPNLNKSIEDLKKQLIKETNP